MSLPLATWEAAKPAGARALPAAAAAALQPQPKQVLQEVATPQMRPRARTMYAVGSAVSPPAGVAAVGAERAISPLHSLAGSPSMAAAPSRRIPLYFGKVEGSLGVQIVGTKRKDDGAHRGLFVGKINSTGPNRKRQLLRVGDRIVAVNELSIEGMTNDAALDVLKRTTTSGVAITLTVVRKARIERRKSTSIRRSGSKRGASPATAAARAAAAAAGASGRRSPNPSVSKQTNK